VLHHLVDPVRGDRSLHRTARVVLHRPEERCGGLTPVPRSASTQTVALSALLFLSREVLKRGPAIRLKGRLFPLELDELGGPLR
jgi:hypothetical protein